MAGHGGAFAVREFRFWLTNYRWDPLESTCRHASLSIL